MQRVAVIVICVVVGTIAIVLGIRELTDKPETTSGGPDQLDVEGGGRTVTVRIEDREFIPENVSVGLSQTVRWVNQDDFAHTVTKESGEGEDFDSGDIEGGGTYERSFDEIGRASNIEYVCEIHPGMKATVSVIDD